MSRYLTLEEVAILAQRLHTGQVDKAGYDYYTTHVLDVYQRCFAYKSELILMVALLHDVVEDTNMNTQDLVSAGVNPVVASLVDELTHVKNSPRIKYIESMSQESLRVKLQDNLSNSDERRLILLPDELASRLRNKYSKEREIILKLL